MPVTRVNVSTCAPRLRAPVARSPTRTARGTPRRRRGSRTPRTHFETSSCGTISRASPGEIIARGQPMTALQPGALLQHPRRLAPRCARNRYPPWRSQTLMPSSCAKCRMKSMDSLASSISVGVAPLRAHAAAVPAGRAFAEIAALEDQDLARAGCGQVPGERQPHDAAADDDDVRALRQRFARLQRMPSGAPGGAEPRRRRIPRHRGQRQPGIVGKRRRRLWRPRPERHPRLAAAPRRAARRGASLPPRSSCPGTARCPGRCTA